MYVCVCVCVCVCVARHISEFNLVKTSGFTYIYLSSPGTGPENIPSRHMTQWWHRYYVKTTSFWRNYVKMTSFWRYNDIIITSCVQWVGVGSNWGWRVTSRVSRVWWNQCQCQCVSQRHIHVAHDDVIKWKHFPRYWPFVRGIHRSPVNSAHKGHWRGALMFSLVCACINGWVNSRKAGDLRHHRAYYDVKLIVMINHLYQSQSFIPP